MSDIARRAGVSIATVSRVLNAPERVAPETRDKILGLIGRTGFVANAVARSLASRFSHTIGVLVVDISHTYSACVTHTVEQRFADLGYDVLLANTGGGLGEKRKYLSIMLEKKADGMVLVGSVFRERGGNEHIKWASGHVPIVMLNSHVPAPRVYSVLCDDRRGVAGSVERLVALGHRRIVYLSSATTFSGLAKQRGYREAMRRHKLEAHSLQVGRDLEGARNGVRRLLQAGQWPTAIVTGEDITAVGALQELLRAGCRVPKDISVVGYNSSLLSELSTPRLTSVDSRMTDMASTAVDVLYEVLKGRRVQRRTVLRPTLVERESTGPAPD
jgi:DNA-binding LacI/PurR family transcriptional regulator